MRVCVEKPFSHVAVDISLVLARAWRTRHIEESVIAVSEEQSATNLFRKNGRMIPSAGIGRSLSTIEDQPTGPQRAILEPTIVNFNELL